MNAEYYKLLNELLSFCTISKNENNINEMKKCSNRIENIFLNYGFKVDKINNTNIPIIIASYHIDDDNETGIIYGNYDTTPANQKDGRKENPFGLYIGKDQIIGRGIADGKGIILLYMLNIFKLIKENKLKYNIIFIIEGEKEIDSPTLKQYLSQHPIKADFIISSYGTKINNIPTINNSFRGGFSAKIDIETTNQPVNINQYGGVFDNSVIEAVNLLGKLYDINKQNTIPYFYYDMEGIPVNDKIRNGKIPFDLTSLQAEYGNNKTNLQDIDLFTKVGNKPCVEITGISGGTCDFFSENTPHKSSINVNIKLIMNQKTENIKTLFEEWVKSNISKNVSYKINFSNGSDAIKINTENYFANKAQTIASNIFNKEIISIASGFEYPIASTFSKYISKNIVNIPLLNDDCKIYNTNENFNIESIKYGFNFVYEYFKK